MAISTGVARGGALVNGITMRLVTITAVVETQQARVRLELGNGSPGQSVYVLRRDDGSGTAIVRETSEGTVTWPDDNRVTLYDYEPLQGSVAEYIVTNPDGLAVASTTVRVPQWGTWLKSPGRPYRNARVHYQGEGGADMQAARRLLVPVQDSPQRVVFAQPRLSEQGQLQLLTRTREQADALDRLLRDGMPLMLDVPASWGVPFRYISVGDVQRARAHDLEGLNLTAEARVWTLDDVVTIDPPQGVPTLDASRTYTDLPTLFATYVAIPSTTATYEQLATGESED